MLLDPTSTRLDTAVSAAPAVIELSDATDIVDTPAPRPGPDPVVPDAVHDLPADLATLVSRARRDRGSALALVHLLLERGWTTAAVGAALGDQVGLTRTQIEALATVRRPRTSASDVADRLVAARHAPTRVPHPRRS